MSDKIIKLPQSFVRFGGTNLLFEDENYIWYENPYGVVTYKNKKYLELLQYDRGQLEKLESQGTIKLSPDSLDIIIKFLNYHTHNMGNIINIYGMGEDAALKLAQFIGASDEIKKTTVENILKNRDKFSSLGVFLVVSPLGDREYTDDFISMLNNLDGRFIVLSDFGLNLKPIETYHIKHF